MFFSTARSIINLAKELLALCRDWLAGYKLPKRFGFTAALPSCAFAKVLKRELRGREFPSVFDATALRSLENAS